MNPLTFRKRRRQAREDALAVFLARRRYLRDDVTVFGEEMSELHFDTLTETLDEDARDYYRHALESYDRAKAGLESAADAPGLEPVVTALVEGRHQRACVLALAAGEPMPAKLEECFFNPQHGPSSARIEWTPPGGVAREVSVCAADAQRIKVGEQPKIRLVRIGDRYVPWMVAGDPVGGGYFPPLVDDRSVREGIRQGQAGAVLYGALPSPMDNAGGGGFGSM